MGKDTVTAAQAAAKSSVALEALEGGQISLAEAAALTEFEHDGPEAVDRLVRAAGTPQFDHVVSQLRSERASAQALAQATAHYTERGFTILDEEQRWGWDPERVPMRYLQRDGDDGEPEGVDESVITDPQHWAVWLDEYTQYVDSDGNVVEEDEIDWDTADDADAEPDEGLRHADSVRERPAFAPEWFCLNPEAAGLQVSEMYQRNADWYARQHRGQSHTAGRDADNHDSHDSDDSDAEREAARLRAEAERAEAERRERRKVITLNKLGAAAIEVRRQFVTTLLARKTLPKGAATFLADCLARDSYMLTQHNRDDVAAELLGIDRAAVPTAVSELPAGSDNRALVIALALVLGSLEARTGKDAWRNPAPVRDPGDHRTYYGYSVTSGDYLRFLAANGHTLAEVEEVVTGTRTADDAYDSYLRVKEGQQPDDE